MSRSKNQGSVFPQQIIDLAELPLACPTAKMTLWNAHPRVYLPIEQTGEAICPYCNTHYILKDDRDS